ncbi:hypothetical protein [Streptomyces sp.]|uniref:hypothetical protein n=1 Tax=Streptomyces sp. TaxID=1931 RepID=UPI002F3FC795
MLPGRRPRPGAHCLGRRARDPVSALVTDPAEPRRLLSGVAPGDDAECAETARLEPADLAEE